MPVSPPPSTGDGHKLLSPSTSLTIMRNPNRPMLRNYSDLATRVGKKRVTYKCGGSASSLLLNSVADAQHSNSSSNGGMDRATTPPHSILKKSSVSPLTLTPTEPLSPGLHNYAVPRTTDFGNDGLQQPDATRRLSVPRVVLESMVDDQENAPLTRDIDEIFTFRPPRRNPNTTAASTADYQLTNDELTSCHVTRQLSPDENEETDAEEYREQDESAMYTQRDVQKTFVGNCISRNDRSVDRYDNKSYPSERHRVQPQLSESIALNGGLMRIGDADDADMQRQSLMVTIEDETAACREQNNGSFDPGNSTSVSTV